MLIAMNIGNTNIRMGLWDGYWVRQICCSMKECRSLSEVRPYLRELLQRELLQRELFQRELFQRELLQHELLQIEHLQKERNNDCIDGCIIASVVPHMDEIVRRAVIDAVGFLPIFVEVSSSFGLDVSQYKGSLGSDRFVCCVAALKKYKPPFIVFDFGTATTANVVDNSSVFQGGVILPGIRLSLEALSKGTAKLPDISIHTDAPFLGKDARECMLSGVVYGAVHMMEGFVSRTEKLLGSKVTVIVTGGNSEVVLQHSELIMYHEPTLLLDGLIDMFKAYTVKGDTNEKIQ